MPPKQKAANPFDEQLAALRQRISLPPSRPDESTTTTTRSTTIVTSTQPRPLWLEGSFTAPEAPVRVPLSSSHAVVDDRTASMLQTLSYLKLAARARCEEFIDMEEQFLYDVDEQTELHAARCQVPGERRTLYFDGAMNEPFVFEAVQQRPEAAISSSNTVTPRSTPTTPQPAGTATRGASSSRLGSSSRHSGTFDAAYDITTALSSTKVPLKALPAAKRASSGASMMPTTGVQPPPPQRPLSSLQHRAHRPPCTAEVMNDARIHFCRQCGLCTLGQRPDASPCSRCGELPKVVADDAEALRILEEAEQREALAFQAAIAQWRAGADDAPPLIDNVAPTATTSSTHTDPYASIGRHTYFAHLWSQMEQAR